MTRGRKRAEDRLEDLRKALRSLRDPIVLEESPLARVRYVQLKAEREYRRRTCSVGLALSATLRSILRQLGEDLKGTPLGELAASLETGSTQAEVAKKLGMREEFISRRVKPALLSVLHREIQRLNSEGI